MIIGQNPNNNQVSYQGWLKNAMNKAAEVTKKELTFKVDPKSINPKYPTIESQTAAFKKLERDTFHGRRKPDIVADY